MVIVTKNFNSFAQTTPSSKLDDIKFYSIWSGTKFYQWKYINLKAQETSYENKNLSIHLTYYSIE